MQLYEYEPFKNEFFKLYNKFGQKIESKQLAEEVKNKEEYPILYREFYSSKNEKKFIESGILRRALEIIKNEYQSFYLVEINQKTEYRPPIYLEDIKETVIVNGETQEESSGGTYIMGSPESVKMELDSSSYYRGLLPILRDLLGTYNNKIPYFEELKSVINIEKLQELIKTAEDKISQKEEVVETKPIVGIPSLM